VVGRVPAAHPAESEQLARALRHWLLARLGQVFRTPRSHFLMQVHQRAAAVADAVPPVRFVRVFPVIRAVHYEQTIGRCLLSASKKSMASSSTPASLLPTCSPRGPKPHAGAHRSSGRTVRDDPACQKLKVTESDLSATLPATRSLPGKDLAEEGSLSTPARARWAMTGVRQALVAIGLVWLGAWRQRKAHHAGTADTQRLTSAPICSRATRKPSLLLMERAATDSSSMRSSPLKLRRRRRCTPTSSRTGRRSKPPSSSDDFVTTGPCTTTRANVQAAIGAIEELLRTSRRRT